MRIIGGEFRSRRIKSIPGTDVRPTTDRLRETLFNILAPEIEGVTFVDAYAGTGAVGLEALSRGAAKAVLIEKSHDALEALEENVKSLGVGKRCQVIRGSAHLYAVRHAGDIVFLDPPYGDDKQYEVSLAALGDTGTPLVVVQHDVRRKLPESVGKLKAVRVVRQGTNVLTFYRQG